MTQFTSEIIRKSLSHFDPDLVNEILNESSVVHLESGKEILRAGQYVKAVPLVLEGLIKVYTRFEEKELLLYYIEPSESCVMSFSASMENAPSEVFAVTEAPTIALLLPSEKLRPWTKSYPGLNRLFFQLFNARYSELIDTINHLLYQKLDVRIMNFLKERARVKSEETMRISHRQIALELGTAREVVTRLLKKMEADGLLIQETDGIRIL
jgi:CRP/FNR family transcriptional regulator